MIGVAWKAPGCVPNSGNARSPVFHVQSIASVDTVAGVRSVSAEYLVPAWSPLVNGHSTIPASGRLWAASAAAARMGTANQRARLKAAIAAEYYTRDCSRKESKDARPGRPVFR